MSGEANERTKLWGGRFDGAVDPEVDRFTRSFGFDHVLAPWDCLASLAHSIMLQEQGILEPEAGQAIASGLRGMISDLEAGSLPVEGDFEDVHAWLESTLQDRIGEHGKRLHTARSRNDQVAVAQRLWLRAQLESMLRELLAFADQLAEAATLHTEVALPGYTHLQRGQPVSLAHHLLAWVWMLEGDARRLRAAHVAAGASPLGAAAMAGSTFAISPERTAELLGFERVFPNSMHAVADRDYVVEASFACALLQVHLSRWAEEVVLWSTKEFGFVELDDSVAKGSSIMPQKKNPEPAEVLRGKAGRTIGDVVAHLVQLKGLPLTYNSDLQEDKEALFDAIATARGSLAVARALQAGIRFQPDAMQRALHGGFVTATDLADALVRGGLSFRDAHERTGNAVRRAEERGCELWELSFEELSAACPGVEPQVFEELEPAASLKAHDSPGGPAPVRVKEQLDAATAALGKARAWLDQRSAPPLLDTIPASGSDWSGATDS